MIFPTPSTTQHHRSTRFEILARDIDVQNLVDELRKSEHRNWNILADCIERCRAASVLRAGWRSSSEAILRATDRYRCKTLACPACGTSMWRRALRKVLDRFHGVDVEDLSLVTVTGSYATDMDAVRIAIRKLRRSLRDLRDAMAKKRSSWRDVEFAGLVDLMPTGDRDGFSVRPIARLLVHHPRVSRSGIERVMRDWFSGSGRDVDVGPYREDALSGSLPGVGLPMPWRVLVVATLFEWGRGTEPLRIAVGSQRLCVSGAVGKVSMGQGTATFREPMPMVF